MKKTNFFWLLLFSATLTICNGCSEGDEEPVKANIPIVDNTQLRADAGYNFQVILPIDYGVLSGGYTSVNHATIDGQVWQKVSGPDTYLIKNPNLLRAEISQLKKGIYKFELTVKYNAGFASKDTVQITVDEMPLNPQEMIFKDLKWFYPWSNMIEIPKFNLVMPQSVFRVYIQRDDNPNWIEVNAITDVLLSSEYVYFLQERQIPNTSYAAGSLYISYDGNDANDTPSVKIVY